MNNVNIVSQFISDYTNKERCPTFAFALSILQVLTKAITHTMTAHSCEQTQKTLELKEVAVEF